MNQGLFESLTGHFLDMTPVDSEGAKAARVHSIMDNLNRLFNTRQGMLPHLKDFGIPDISEIYRTMPQGVAELQQAMTRTVQRYEPRLKKVKIIRRETEKREFKMVFILSAELAEGGQVRFQTVFTSMGNSAISPWKSMDETV
jgi:type VI secretion system protein